MGEFLGLGSSLKDSTVLEDAKPAEGSGGELFIKVIGAALIRDTEALGKMDPYFQITYNGEVYKTKVISEGGKNPQWNESFDIEIKSLQDEIKFTVYDEDSMTNDLVGERLFKVRSICQAALTQRTIPLIYQGKRSGDVSIETSFVPEAERKVLYELPSKAPLPDNELFEQ